MLNKGARKLRRLLKTGWFVALVYTVAGLGTAWGTPPDFSGSPSDGVLPDWGGRLQSAFGIVVFLGVAWLWSSNRKHINRRVVVAGLSLQLFLGLVVQLPAASALFSGFNGAVMAVLDCSNKGAEFLFGRLAVSRNLPVGPSTLPPPEAGAEAAWMEAAKMGEVEVPGAPPWRFAPVGATFAFGVLPTLIFFSALMGVLYHLGVMPRLIRLMAWAMHRTMGTSGAESFSAAGNIFVGQTEAPLLIRPFIEDLTESELMAVMTGGFATVAGGVMVAYVGMLHQVFPGIAGHLLSASLMSAPAALVVAKIMVPEPDPKCAKTYGGVDLGVWSEATNVVDAAAKGSAIGLKLALNVGAMLLSFVALIALFNGGLAWVSGLLGLGQAWSLERVLGLFLAPVAWCMGVPWEDAPVIGSLLGVKTVLNEFYAYLRLHELSGTLVHRRSMVIATYALCGFANFSSIAIQIGGIGTLAPARQRDLARLGFKAMVGGSLAAFLTACVVGLWT